MLGRKKRNRLQEDGFPEEEYPEEEYPEEILPEEEYLTDGTEKYTPVREADYDPEAGMYPEEEYSQETGSGPDGSQESWADEGWDDGEWEEEPEDMWTRRRNSTWWRWTHRTRIRNSWTGTGTC